MENVVVPAQNEQRKANQSIDELRMLRIIIFS